MLADLPGLLANYGPLLVFIIALVAASGLPSPATMTLLVAGGLSALGQIDYAWVFAAGWAGTVAGDHLVRYLASRVSDRLTGKRFTSAMARAEKVIARWGVLGVFGSRFIFPTVLTPGVNYFCGLSRYPLSRFTPAVIAGEGVYVGGYSMLGRVFNTQLRQIESAATTASLLVLALIAALVCLAVLLRTLLRKA